MDIRAYRYFEVLASDLNMTHASKKLGITQQALSSQIARLDKHYQVSLFTRTPRLKLTYAGVRLLEYSKSLNVWSAQVAEELQEIHDGERGQIFIGASAKRGSSLLPLLFPAFHAEYPNVEVCMVEGGSVDLAKDMLEERTDFCIVVTKIDDPRVRSIPIQEERTLLFISDEALMRYCPSRYEELVEHKERTFPIEYFKTCPFILNSSNNRVRKRCDKLFFNHNIVPHTIFSSTNAMNLAEVAQQGFGATFLNSSTRPSIVAGLHRFLIQDLSEPDILKISYMQGHYLSRPALRFMNLTREILPQNTALPQNSIPTLW